MASTLRQNYTTGDDTNSVIYGNAWRAQTFTVAESHEIDQVDVYLGKTGAPTGTLTVGIYTTSAGKPVTAGETALAEGTKAVADIAAGPAWVTITFDTPYALTPGTKYAIVLHGPVGDGTKYINWRLDGTTPTYTDGSTCTSANAGVLWTAIAAQDQLFKEYGDFYAPGAAPVDKRFSKYLIAIGNNELWYGATVADMTELAAAKNEIDCSKPLQIFELYEKVFVVNGTNLKVADFGNTKITTDDILPAGVIPLHGDVLTATGGAASGAQMVVDYIDASDGACNVYGKRITAATFLDTDVVTGTNANGDISFTLNANETAPPHWYDWTVYAGSTTYGTMPTQAVLGCPWRGRACLSGDEDYPHQYYQARQENPWDWNYVSADVQSPVAGGGDPSIPGQVGDLVIAQIPFDRDHLIYGGANSLWVLTGDAAEGGTLNCFYDEGGVLGALAWCKDNSSNLYIMSTVGLLKVPQGFGPPENLTEFVYPDFVKDLAYNVSTYRIVIGYDRKRNGIKIQRTTLATGANTGWWYDLKTKALYPESYGSTEHGIFSMFHYEAVDPDYNVLLLGCNNGYLYYENDSATDDTLADDSAQAIDSYITFGPIKLGEENQEGKVNSLVGVLAGGGSGGSETDSDDIAFKIWTELSADRISERFSANSGQNVSGTIKAPGRWRGNQFRRSIRGMFAGLRIGNSTAGETWGLERLLLGIKRAGRMK